MSETSSIFVVTAPVEAINEAVKNTAVSALGIVFTEVGPDYVRGTMPVDDRTVQPMRLLHGGASVLLAETLGSQAANMCLDPRTHYAVGLDINANHIRSATKGFVVGTARPLHLGRGTHVWEIRIETDDGKLVCISRLTMAVLERPR